MPYSLHTAIHDVVGETGFASQDDIAQMVAEHTSSRDLRLVLAEALPTQVRERTEAAAGPHHGAAGVA